MDTAYLNNKKDIVKNYDVFKELEKVRLNAVPHKK